MKAEFSNSSIKITANSDVMKSEDAVNYVFLFRGGVYLDTDICIPSEEGSSNFYFYKGDGEVVCVEVKNQMV